MSERPARPGNDLRSLPTLVAALLRDLAALVRGEIRLAQAEIREHIREAAASVLALILGALVLYAAFLLLLAAAVLGLTALLPPDWAQTWIAAAIIGLFVALIGAALVAKAWSDLRDREFILSRSRRQMKQNRDLAEDHLPKAD